jgi:hypothetical protein
MTAANKERINQARRKKYASDPEYRQKCKDAVARYRQKQLASDPDFKARLLGYSSAYRARQRKLKNNFFASITKSPETLADKSVYLSVSRDGKYHTYSSPWIQSIHLTREEAVATTVAKLREVMV